MVSWITSIVYIVFMFVTMTNIGATYDGFKFAPLVEAARCLVCAVYFSFYPILTNETLHLAVQIYLIASVFLWSGQSLKIILQKEKSLKSE